MRKIILGILTVFILHCTNTTEGIYEKISLEFSTGINLPDFYIQLDKINELIRGYEIIKDTSRKGSPYDENIPLVDQINRSPTKFYSSSDELLQDYPFYKYFYPNGFNRRDKINSPIIGFAHVSNTSIVNNYIHKFADSINLSKPYTLEWYKTCIADSFLLLKIFEFENNSKEILDDKLIRSIYYKPSGLSATSKFRRFLSKLNNQESYELIIEFEQSLVNQLSFEKSIPLFFTFKFNKIEYSKAFTLNELLNNNYQVSICDKLPGEDLNLLKSNYDMIKIKI